MSQLLVTLINDHDVQHQKATLIKSREIIFMRVDRSVCQSTQEISFMSVYQSKANRCAKNNIHT
jgi:hypothetical protein